MKSDNTTQRGSATVHDGRDSETHSTGVVLVADSDPAITDEVAGLLRDEYVVRTAYTGADALSSLDDGVDVVLMDPTVRELSTRDVVDHIENEAYSCRIASLSEQRPRDDHFDGHVRKPVTPASLKSTVDRLCRSVVYRSTLDRYYELAQARASLPEDDPQRDRLTQRLADLEGELDGVASDLDSDDAYEAALYDRATDN